MPLTTTAVWPDLVAGKKAKASEVESKFDWIEGSLWPMASGTTADNTYDLGADGKSWKAAWVKSINPTSTADGLAIGKAIAGSSTSLDLSAMPKALLLPIVTTVQQSALTATAGMIVYNSTNARMERYEGGQWLAMNNPIGYADRIDYDATGNTNFQTTCSIIGSGRIRNISFRTSNNSFPVHLYFIIDGTSWNTITSATTTAYPIEVDNTYGNPDFKISYTTTVIDMKNEISFKNSFIMYQRTTNAGEHAYSTIVYEVS